MTGQKKEIDYEKKGYKEDDLNVALGLVPLSASSNTLGPLFAFHNCTRNSLKKYSKNSSIIPSNKSGYDQDHVFCSYGKCKFVPVDGLDQLDSLPVSFVFSPIGIIAEAKYVFPFDSGYTYEHYFSNDDRFSFLDGYELSNFAISKNLNKVNTLITLLFEDIDNYKNGILKDYDEQKRVLTSRDESFKALFEFPETIFNVLAQIHSKVDRGKANIERVATIEFLFEKLELENISVPEIILHPALYVRLDASEQKFLNGFKKVTYLNGKAIESPDSAVVLSPTFFTDFIEAKADFWESHINFIDERF